MRVRVNQNVIAKKTFFPIPLTSKLDPQIGMPIGVMFKVPYSMEYCTLF